MDPKQIKNILVIRNDRFGEFLLNIPALHALKNRFNALHLTILVDPQVRELAGHISSVYEVLTWENRKHNLIEIIRFGLKLRGYGFDAAVMLNPKKEFNLLAFFAGIPVRVGYDRKWGFLLTHKIKDEKSLGLKHEVEYNLDLAKLIGATTQDMSVSLNNITADERYRGAIAVHPYASDALKLWPIERFRELALKLGNKVIIVGKTDEPSLGWGAGTLDLTNKTSLMELAGVLKACRFVITGDSGPMHLAVSVGTPVLALFRNDLPGKGPRRWGPWSKDSVVIAKSSLKDIGVDEVINVLTGSKLWKK